MGTPLDPSGLQIAAAIKTTDGTKVDLWMKGSGGGSSISDATAGLVDDALSSLPSGPGLGGMGGGSDSGAAELANMDLPYVETVDVTVSLGLTASVTVVIACPFDVGLHLLETSLFQIGNFIEVQIGYPRMGRFTPWVSAQMSKPSIRINGDEGLSVTINGSGGGFASLRGVSGKVYSGKSYKEIIKDVADYHGWGTQFPGDAGFDLVSELSSAVLGGAALGDDPLDEARERISQESLSDWFFVQKLARTAGCDAFLGPNSDGDRTLFVKRRKEALSQSPQYKLLMRGNPNFDNVFPILNFESEAEGVWLQGASVETRSSDIDPDTREVVDERASASTTEEASLGGAGVPTDASTKIDGEQAQLTSAGGGNERTGEYIATSRRDPRGQKAVAQAHRDESIIRGGINALVSTYGIPELFPGAVIEIDGLGIFNSNYYIDGVTWSANSSEFLTKLTCRNNATADGLIDKTFLADPSSTNTEQVSDDDLLSAAGGGGLLAEAKDVAGI